MGSGRLRGEAEAFESVQRTKAWRRQFETALIFFLPILFVSRQKEWD
jgi:hypothetical protein